MSQSPSSRAAPPRQAAAVNPAAPANDAANDDAPGAGAAIAAMARGWPGPAIAIGADGRIAGASSLSAMLEGMRAPFDLPAAPVSSQVADAAGRVWRVSAPVAGVRFATTDTREEPDAAQRFTAAVSHEIRTPLNGILGMAALLEETPLTAEQNDYVSAIRKSGGRLLDLLNNVLDYSRMEAGDIPLERAPFDVADLVQDVAELLAPRAHGAGIDIAACVEPGMPARFIGDAGRLRQILFNLAGNSVKFTAQGGVLVTARAGPGGKGLSLLVCDTGSGIPDHARARLFDAFSQASAADARRDGGVGLGLAIVARLVAAMNGTIAVQSAWREGAVFRVDLPLDPAPEPAAGAAHAALAGGAKPRDARSRRVTLSIDLPPASRIACLAALAQENLRITGPEDAGSAHIALVDAALPPARIAAQARRAPTLVVLRPGDRSRIEQFRAMGCAGYLIRPLRPASVVERVRLALGGAVETGADGEAEAAPAPGSAGAVLVADDNAVNALLASRALSAAGFRVDIAATGAEALERAGETLYSAIFMDIRMPVMDGLEATRRIRRLGGPAGAVPVIALTADDNPDLEYTARAAGVSALASKPIDPARLRELALRWASRNTAGDA